MTNKLPKCGCGAEPVVFQPEARTTLETWCVMCEGCTIRIFRRFREEAEAAWRRALSRPAAPPVPGEPMGTIVVSEDAYAKFIEACENPKPPTPELIALFRKFRSATALPMADSTEARLVDISNEWIGQADEGELRALAYNLRAELRAALADNTRLREVLHIIVCNTEPDAIKHRSYEDLARDICQCARAALTPSPRETDAIIPWGSKDGEPM